MKTKEEKTEQEIADEAINILPEAKQMLVESTGLHTVLALSLADIYGGEARRLKAKLGSADPRVADAKLRKGIAAEHAKEIVETLVSRRSPLAEPATAQPKEDKATAPKTVDVRKAKETTPPAASTEGTGSASKPRTKSASTSKAALETKAKPKTGSTAGSVRSKADLKKAPVRKGKPRSK